MADFAVFAEGLADLDDIKDLTKNIRRAAMLAINSTATTKRTRAARMIRGQVALPASYVAPGTKRLYVSQRAIPGRLEAKITARGRATSLARFTSGGKVGKPGVYVTVQPGKARFMKRAFLIRLPQGSSLTDTRFNLGLALRLAPGERLNNKISSRALSKGLYLLYGPSVDQVFRANSGEGVANDLVPEIERDLAAEFYRLLEI